MTAELLDGIIFDVEVSTAFIRVLEDPKKNKMP